MIKEALQYIIGLQQPRTEDINGKKYYFKDGAPMLVGGCHRCKEIQLSTLSSLVDYIKEDMCADFQGDVPKMIVHIASETNVRLVTQFNSDMARWEVVDVNARVPEVALNRFMEQEAFIIQMQSMFLDTPDKAVVMKVAGNVEDRTVANYGDDGVSQKATVKTGLVTVEDVIVPNPVTLMPFRTFHEVEQQEIEFVFRMKNTQGGVSCALFEADGGAWKFRAVHEIADYLKEELKGMDNISVLS